MANFQALLASGFYICAQDSAPLAGSGALSYATYIIYCAFCASALTSMTLICGAV